MMSEENLVSKAMVIFGRWMPILQTALSAFNQVSQVLGDKTIDTDEKNRRLDDMIDAQHDVHARLLEEARAELAASPQGGGGGQPPKPPDD